MGVNYTSVNMGQQQSPYPQGTLRVEKDPWYQDSKREVRRGKEEWFGKSEEQHSSNQW